MIFSMVRGNSGLLEEVIEKWERTGHVAKGIGHLLAGLFAKGNDFSGGGNGISRDSGNATEEEFNPTFPVAIAADRGEAVIVF